MIKMLTVACMVIVFVVVTVLIPVPSAQTKSEQTLTAHTTQILSYSDPAGPLYRVVDMDAGVVCWIVTYKGGISCLPISQTVLDGKPK